MLILRQYSGSFKTTEKGALLYWQGGGEEAWTDMTTALGSIDTFARPGLVFNVWENGEIKQYWWPEDGLVADGDVQPYGGAAAVWSQGFTTNVDYPGIPAGTVIGAGDLLEEALKGVLYAVYPPIPAISIQGGNQRARGSSTSVTLQYSVTKRTNPVTQITVAGVDVPVTSANPQTGTVNVTATQDVNQTYTMQVESDGSADQSASVQLEWLYEIFWGAGPTPTDGDEARALPSSKLANSNNTFTLNTFTTATTFNIVLPPNKTLVSVVDQDLSNQPITEQYLLISDTFVGKDESGEDVPNCKLYVKSQSVPYSFNHRHNITIANG